MSPPLRLGALVSVLVAATAVGPVGAPAAEAPKDWLVDSVRFEPFEPATPTLVEGLQAYRGTIEFRAGGGGVAVVNELGLEDYVRGVVEVPATWPEEALKAQAIAARTYALNRRESTASSPWRDAGAHLCATQACQVYSGVAGEERENGSAWAAAVEATAGQALLLDGRPILAEYSSSNGGRSVPGSASYLRAVNDPDDSYSPHSRWRLTLPLERLASLAGVSPPATVGDVSRAGDTIVLAVQPPEGEPVEQTMGVSDFVAAVGGELPAYGDLPVAFPSYRFDVSSEGGEVIIDGRGWGHGRGMSQWGAYGKARRGWEAADILAAYYAGIRPEPLPEELRGQPIRVAVGSGRRSGAVTPSRPFRVVDGEGTVLAAVALGRWRVAQEKGRLRVSPPEGFGDALAVKAARVHPGRVVAGAPAALRFELAAPAFVTVRVRGPGAPSEPVASLLLDAGEAKVGLPRLRYGGQHVVVIEAEAGPGRRVKTTVPFRVQGQSVYGASLPEPAPERQAWVAVACLLAVGVAIAGWAALPRVRPSPSRAPR